MTMHGSLLPRGEELKVAKAKGKGGRCFGYIRVSSYEQQFGTSLAWQEQTIREYYRRVVEPLGIEWGGIIKDVGASAYKKELADRPGGRRLIAGLRRNDHLVAAKLDRLFRSVANSATAMKYFDSIGVTLHCLDINYDSGNMLSRVLLHVVSSIAEMESAIKSERTLAACQTKMRQGKALHKTSPKFGDRICGIRTIYDSDGMGVLIRVHWVELCIARFCWRTPIRDRALTTAISTWAIEKGFSHLAIPGTQAEAKKTDKYRQENVKSIVGRHRELVEPIIDSIWPVLGVMRKGKNGRKDAVEVPPPPVALQQDEIDFVRGKFKKSGEAASWELLWDVPARIPWSSQVFDLEPVPTRMKIFLDKCDKWWEMAGVVHKKAGRPDSEPRFVLIKFRVRSIKSPSGKQAWTWLDRWFLTREEFDEFMKLTPEYHFAVYFDTEKGIRNKSLIFEAQRLFTHLWENEPRRPFGDTSRPARTQVGPRWPPAIGDPLGEVLLEEEPRGKKRLAGCKPRKPAREWKW